MDVELLSVFLQILTLIAVCINTGVNIVYRIKK